MSLKKLVNFKAEADQKRGFGNNSMRKRASSCIPPLAVVYHFWLTRFLWRFSALSLRLRTLQSTAPASKNEGSADRAARRVACTMLPRKTSKIECKIDPKSIEVGRSRYVQAPKSIEVGRSGSVEAPKSIEVGRSKPSSSSWHDEQARGYSRIVSR